MEGRSDWPPPLPTAEPPTLIEASDGLYHGEAIALTAGTDVGQLLARRLAEQPAAPKIVLHLSGSGEIATSPLRVKGADLAIYVTPPADAKTAPLVLFPRVQTSAGQPALI